MLKFLVSILAALSFAQIATAEIEITSVIGDSAFDPNLNNLNDQGTPIIYGGVGGLEANCDEEGSEGLCDTCEDLTSGFGVCNERRIYDDLILRISFRSDQNNSEGEAFLEDNQGNRLTLIDSTNRLGSGAVHTIQIQWDEICDEIDNTGTCEGVADSVQLRLVIDDNGDTRDSDDITIIVADPDPTKSGDKDTLDLCDDSDGTDAEGGICDWVAYPGDEKIFLDQVSSGDSAFPNEDDTPIKSVRVFISDDEGNAFDAIAGPGSTGNLDPEDLEVFTEDDNDPEIDQVIDGLTNGRRYYLKVGVVDLAGNLSRVTSVTAIDDTCGSNSAPASDGSCTFSATPLEVFGLLSEDFNCFIASVSYGNPLDKRIDVFRKFRSDILWKRKWGRKLTKMYYKHGPKAAVFIHERPYLKPFVVAALWPALGFSWLANVIGLWSATGLTLILIALTVMATGKALHFARFQLRSGREA
ncbi:MAG: CFI-box-CTERM domain-containing protein [Pseudomonadota bacterium]